MSPDLDAAAMAQAMGFSSFGAQDRPQKKRRYNAEADSVTSAQAPPHHGSRASATGSNSTPLRTPAANASANADEIDLEDDADGATSSHVLSDENVKSTTTLPTGLPARPAPGTGFVGASSDKHAARSRFQQPPQRQHNELWYKGYYDSTSNENPWERLEKAMGLETKGVWVARSVGTRAMT